MGKVLTSESAGSANSAGAAVSGRRRQSASEFHRIQRLPDGPHVNLEYGRLTLALLLSLLMHAMLLSLTFGGQGLWPGFGFPWQARRIEAPDLSVVVVPARTAAFEPAGTTAAEPMQETSAPSLASAPAPSVSHVQILRRTATETMAEADPAPVAIPATDVATSAAPAQMPLRADRSGGAPLPLISVPPVIAMTPIDESTWAVPVSALPTPAIAPAPSAPSPETVTPPLQQASDAAQVRIEQEARERAAELAKIELSKREAQRQAEQVEMARQEAARQETLRAKNARQEDEREEMARREAERVEAAKVEAARQEAAKIEAARVEATRVEAARVEAARQEAMRVEAARAEAARAEASRAEAARAEAAKAEAAKAEAAKAEAARQEVAKAEAARQQAAKVDEVAAREARLRAIGRQLDEEAARRDAATAAARQALPSSSSRRYRLFGRTDPNTELILYAEAWARKIQLNLTFDMVREAAKQPHTDPVVTVAIRSDGSVESVTFVRSSGVPALDDAIRRVVQSQTPYQEFPPGLTREFDVIEIRRTWYFDIAIRLY